MKQLLKKCQFYLLTLLYFFKPRKSPETPSHEVIKHPTPIIVEDDVSERMWTVSEITVALYVALFGVESLGLTIESIAQSIGRTEGAFIRKGYRLLSIVKYQKASKTLYPSIMGVYSYLATNSDTQCLKSFYRSMIKISILKGTGVESYYQMKYDGLVSLEEKE